MTNVYYADVVKNHGLGWVLITSRYCDFFPTYADALREAYVELAAGVLVGCMINDNFLAIVVDIYDFEDHYFMDYPNGLPL